MNPAILHWFLATSSYGLMSSLLVIFVDASSQGRNQSLLADSPIERFLMFASGAIQAVAYGAIIWATVMTLRGNEQAPLLKALLFSSLQLHAGINRCVETQLTRVRTDGMLPGYAFHQNLMVPTLFSATLAFWQIHLHIHSGNSSQSSRGLLLAIGVTSSIAAICHGSGSLILVVAVNRANEDALNYGILLVRYEAIIMKFLIWLGLHMCSAPDLSGSLFWCFATGLEDQQGRMDNDTSMRLKICTKRAASTTRDHV
ncbi:hypothetical protein IQ07DRAFT_668715 [Pyrenochaeta sp. DS3sAY3a]|nr:hypothetical protein IQ07DRAFT_668715 [Pyrenochaeta sp. DS3sAY3a]